MFVIGLQGGLNIVLDLRLGLLSRLLVLELKRRGQFRRQLRREVHLVDAWLQDAALDVKDAVFILEELLAVLELLMTFDRPVTVLLGPVADEGALLATLELQLDMRRMDRLHDLHVEHAGHLVARLVEGVLSLQLDLALGELTPLILEEEHCQFDNTIFYYYNEYLRIYLTNILV